MHDVDPIGKRTVERAEKAKADRTIWESHWEEIAERMLPSQRGSFLSKSQVKGEKRTEKIFDSTAVLAVPRFAAVVESLVAPRNSRWHGLVPGLKRLIQDREVSLFFEELTDLLFKYRYSPKANFAGQYFEINIALGAFGTGALFVDEQSVRGIRYKSMPLGSTYFLENYQGVIDTMFAHMKYTARQAEQKFGRDRLPDAVIQDLDLRPDKEHEFLHAISPNADKDPTKKDSRGMDFTSLFIYTKEKTLISRGGYREFPVAVSRYITTTGEIYGRSPGMLALPSVKTLNEEKKTVLTQGHRAVAPVLLTHDDGIVDGFSLKPGALNSGGVTEQGRALVHALPVGNLAVGREMMNDERLVINDAFLVTLFQLLTDSPQATATEVLEKTREKGILLGPTMGRQQSEFLGPMIVRELEILARQNLLPQPPEQLLEVGGEFEVEYDSPLSRAQRAEEASGLFRSMEFAQAHSAATGDPSAFDHLNVDAAMPELMAIHAVPTRWRNGAKEIEAVRKQRAEQVARQQAIEAAPAAAGLAKAGVGGGA